MPRTQVYLLSCGKGAPSVGVILPNEQRACDFCKGSGEDPELPPEKPVKGMQPPAPVCRACKGSKLYPTLIPNHRRTKSSPLAVAVRQKLTKAQAKSLRASHPDIRVSLEDRPQAAVQAASRDGQRACDVSVDPGAGGIVIPVPDGTRIVHLRAADGVRRVQLSPAQEAALKERFGAVLTVAEPA